MARNKLAQATIWVIVALGLVAVIAILFLFRNKSPGGQQEITYDPQGFIRKCVSDEVNKYADEILPKGGFENPRGSITFNNITVGYLCKNDGLYKPCINQHPTYVDEIAQEIKNDIQPGVVDCFVQLKQILTDRNIKVSDGNMSFSVDLAPRRIVVSINKELNMQGNEAAQSIKDWRIEVNHPIYNLANVAVEIGNQEAVYCYFEYVGYMMLYPDFIITKKALTEGTKLYSIKDVKTEKELVIATRGCVIPPGM